MKTRFSTYLLYLVWLVATVALSGSLFFSEILKMPPCVLCWYQRICMYPLVVVIAVGIFLKDKKVYWYSLPLAIIGWIIAIYHNLLYWKILPESIAPCEAGVSCTTKFIEWFGFVTIPFLSLAAFTLIVSSLFLSYYLRRKE